MDGSTILFQVLAQLGTVTGIAAALIFVGKLAVDHFFKAGIETLKADLKRTNDHELLEVKKKFESALLDEKATADKGIILFQHSVESRAASDERIRRELVAWANPIQGAVKDLISRLTNILDDAGYAALDPATAHSKPDWSIDYDYFLTSTMYLFSQYFCWIRMLEEELSFEIFRSHSEKEKFFENVISVSKALSDYHSNSPYDGSGNDSQVFRLQQRAIGEALAIRDGKRRACMGYNVFVIQKDRELQRFLTPLKNLVDHLQLDQKRAARLRSVLKALQGLEQNCRQLLEMPLA